MAEAVAGEELDTKLNRPMTFLSERLRSIQASATTGELPLQFDPTSAATKLKNWLSWQIT